MTTKKKILLTSLILFLFVATLVPVNVWLTQKSLENKGLGVSNLSLEEKVKNMFIHEAYAKCRAVCIWRRIAFGIWNGFLSNRTAPGIDVGLAFPQPFGGRVLAYLDCRARPPFTETFIIAPVPGPPGPYAALPFSVKKHGVFFPGNWTLGTAVEGGLCGVLVVLCFLLKLSTRFCHHHLEAG